MTTAPFSFDNTPLSFQRYPLSRDPNLVAWNAADQLLINQLLTLNSVPKRIAIFNDEFGAIVCTLLSMSQFNHCQFDWYSDSTIARLALNANLENNQLNAERLSIKDSLSSIETSDIYLIRLPKNLAFFEYQLQSLQPLLSNDNQLIIGAMVKQLVKRVFQLVETHIGELHTSLAQKKARLVFAKTKHLSTPASYPKQWAISELNYQLNDHANVFCLGKFDIGTRFFIQNLPQGPAKHIIDLGCGNGLLGLAALKHYPEAQVSFIDESSMAVASAQQNVQTNSPEAERRCHFILDNCLEHQADASADLILCNPPFHQQNTISTHIAQQMFRDAKRCLSSGGRLTVVANRHLPYPEILKSVFGGFKLLASNNKFVILESIKR